MTVTAEFSLITHLLRRAGLGFSYGELEQYAALGYEGTVEKLLNPKSYPNFDYYDFIRRHPQADNPVGMLPGQMTYFLLSSQHQTSIGRKNGLILAPGFCNGIFQS
ncbi:hypothetical protein OAJ44_05035 [Chloroflexi bacterium]|nr:hypothetical protein [Chloroflexota bacterium]